MASTNLGLARQSVNRFIRQYLQLESVLDYPDGSLLREADVQQTLFLQLFRDGALQHPPSKRYQMRVLMALSRRIEEAISDWDEHV